MIKYLVEKFFVTAIAILVAETEKTRTGQQFGVGRSV
jgi:hypothetical protein